MKPLEAIMAANDQPELPSPCPKCGGRIRKFAEPTSDTHMANGCRACGWVWVEKHNMIKEVEK